MTRKPAAVAVLALASIFALAPAFTGAQPASNGGGQTSTTPGTYKVDPVHSHAVFNVKHANAGTSWGRVNDPTGTIVIGNEGSLENLEVTLELAKIDTDNDKRDEHLRGPDFFNAKQFPQMTFKSTNSKKLDNGNFEVTGDLTIKGNTKPITVTLTKVGEHQAPRLGHRVGYDTEFTVDRLAYGVDYMPNMLGKDVKVFVSLEAVKE